MSGILGRPLITRKHWDWLTSAGIPKDCVRISREGDSFTIIRKPGQAKFSNCQLLTLSKINWILHDEKKRKL